MIKLKELLTEFNKAHFLNLIKQDLKSKKGQLAYANDKIRYSGTPKWERKEWLNVAKDLKKEIKVLQVRVKQVSKMEEGKLTEGTTKRGLDVIKQITGGKASQFGNMTKADWVQHQPHGLEFGSSSWKNKKVMRTQIFPTAKDVYKIQLMGHDYFKLGIPKKVKGNMLYSTLKKMVGI